MNTEKSDDLKGKINLVFKQIKKNTENVNQANSSSNIANKNEAISANINKLEQGIAEWDTLDEPVMETIVNYN